MPPLQGSFLVKFSNFLVRLGRDQAFSRRLAFALGFIAFLSGVATYVVLTSSGTGKTSRVLPYIYIDLTVMLLLAVVIARRLVELWGERKRGLAGSKLHIQIVGLFGFVAVIPAIFVVVFASLFFNVGVQAWFGDPVRQALNEAREVSESYLREHMNAISHDAQAIVREVGPQTPFLISDPDAFSKALTQEGERRGLTEALVFDILPDGKTQIVARSFLTFALEFEKVLLDAFEKAREGEVVVLSSESKDRVRALVKLDPITDTYLYIGKMVDKAVLQHVYQTQGAISEYVRLDNERSGLQITFVLFFSVIGFLLLLAAIWIGLTIANLLVSPITNLIIAAEEVSQGNLSVQIDSPESINNEIGSLALSFNKMITQINNQQQDLLKANSKLDQRRQFIETILSRISAGVLSITPSRRIRLFNDRASALLTMGAPIHKGKSLADISPELNSLVDETVMEKTEQLSRQITIHRKGMTSVLQVSIVLEKDPQTEGGFIITFDDVTALLSAQRKAAWSDVARRIAHEIKNPLTPIQLSAERLKRRYLKEITSDPSTFQACIDTIIRQVSSIGKLVGEFSAFARMPTPVMKQEDFKEILSQAILLQKQANPGIKFIMHICEDPVLLQCDALQMGQVLTNLLQNAINAVTERENTDKNQIDLDVESIISITLEINHQQIVLTIEDNGSGFPRQERNRLTEPYFTTRSKGTGLGLAIVAKIVEDHRGRLELGDSRTLGGAKVVLEFTQSMMEQG